MYGQGDPVQGARLYLRRKDTDMSLMLGKLQRHPLVDDIETDESKITEEAPEECHESACNVHLHYHRRQPLAPHDRVHTP